MPVAERILPVVAFDSLEAYTASGGGRGLEAARAVEPSVVIEELEASGLRGRGGAGFPTGTKWRTVCEYSSDLLATSVVVNAAEGEPGTYKDRTILVVNPYAVLEGALIAAHVHHANTVIVATKKRFDEQLGRLHEAIAEIDAAGWLRDIHISVFEGPGEYLYGEETALLEALDGRQPFPRIAPPYRRGIVEIVEGDDDATSGSGLSAHVEMAGEGHDSIAPSALIDNVETLANVPGIIANGAAWFRELGSAESPGSLVCTVTGAVRHAGVGEMAMGTPLREVIETIGGGIVEGHEALGVQLGVSGAFLPADLFDAPLTYEDFRLAGTGLGSASFIVIDATTSPVALAAGASRFLAIESCGQCTPCKTDGLEIAGILAGMCGGTGSAAQLVELRRRIGTVDAGARCSLASQQVAVVGSLVERYADAFEARTRPNQAAIAPLMVAELVRIVDGVESVDAAFAEKRADWTYGPGDASATPVDRFTDHRAGS